MTYQLHLFILKSYMPQPHLPHHRYELFFISPYCRYNLIFLDQLSHQSALALSGAEVLRIACKPNKQFTLILGSPEKTIAFSNLAVVKREECPHALQRKATGKRATSKVVRRRLVRRGQAWLLGRQHQLLPGRPGGRGKSQYVAITMQR